MILWAVCIPLTTGSDTGLRAIDLKVIDRETVRVTEKITAVYSRLDSGFTVTLRGAGRELRAAYERAATVYATDQHPLEVIIHERLASDDDQVFIYDFGKSLLGNSR